MKKMHHFEIKENERFFEQIFKILGEGGVYMWPDTLKTFTKKEDKLVAEDVEAYNAVEEIVSRKYLRKRFSYDIDQYLNLN
jgi:hypothetical protein|tara:strand:+ start:1259 stop:1501 length:243 start_codon:yes stop_codon:yes gene_type:complete